MYAAPGIGLAATQVDVHRASAGHRRLRGARPSRWSSSTRRSSRATARQIYQEGCLSVPGYFDDVERAERDPRARARPRRQAVRDRTRRPARGLHPARDRPPRRQAVRRLPVGAEARARAQEDREGAKRCARKARAGEPRARRRSDRPSMPCERGLAVVFAGTPDFAVPSLDASPRRAIASSPSTRSPTARAAAAARSPRPVKERALALGLPVLPAGNAARTPTRQRRLRALRAGRDGRRRLRAAAAAGVLDIAEARLPERACLAAAALARRRADRARDPGRRRARPASASCRWRRGSTPGR